MWVPHAKHLSIKLVGQSELAMRPPVQMNPSERGYFDLAVTGTGLGTRYRYVLDGKKERRYPASRF